MYALIYTDFNTSRPFPIYFALPNRVFSSCRRALTLTIFPVAVYTRRALYFYSLVLEHSFVVPSIYSTRSPASLMRCSEGSRPSPAPGARHNLKNPSEVPYIRKRIGWSLCSQLRHLFQDHIAKCIFDILS